MPLETATYINQLDAANPVGSDPIAAGDDHLRLIKSAIKNTFPNVTGAVTVTHTQLNAVEDALPKSGGTMTGPLVLSGNPSASNQAANKAYVDSQVASLVAGVASFNGRTGVVSLTSSDVTTALGFTPSQVNTSTSYTWSQAQTFSAGFTSTSHNFVGDTSWYWTGSEIQGRISGNMKFFFNGSSAGFSISDVQKVGGGSFNTYSDINVKQDISSYNKGLVSIKQLSPKNYKFTSQFMQSDSPSKPFVGLIAQEVETTDFANCVSTGANGLKTLDTSEIVFALVNAVKELSAEVEALKAQISN